MDRDGPRPWWKEPVVLAAGGAIAIHILIAFVGEQLVAAFPVRALPVIPHVELVEIEPPVVETPPPAPVEAAAPQVAPVPVAPTEPPKTEPRPQRVRAMQPPPSNEPPPPPSNEPPNPTSGGGPVTTMEDIAPAARGVPVARGPRGSGSGRGGSGTGTGSGTGAGSSDAPPVPVSVATIKSRAVPKGDFSYFDASRDYPAEAKALGIEGVIRIRLVVDATGAVKSATPLNRLGHGLDELALERAKKILFEPAKDTDDKPVASVVVWTFNMTLPK